MSKIAIIGASANRSKFGNKAVRAYLNRGWTVWPINPKEAEIEGQTVFADLSSLPERPDRVGLYVPPAVAANVVRELDKLYPGQSPEIWINPGVGDRALFELVEELGVNAVNGCAIVDIGESPSSYPG